MSHIRVDGYQIEYAWHGPASEQAPTLVMLHEGLGCVAMWRDFPQLLFKRTGCGVLVYSRVGYGKSDPTPLPREVRFMHDEALTTLPQMLDAFAIREAVLLGHSDGGSIALINAGGKRDARIRALILEAPHVFVEEVGITSIEAISVEYRSGELKSRLARYHGENVDATFWGWNDIWLDPAFRSWNIEECLRQIHIPILLIQGTDDQYGTLEQIRTIERGCQGPVRTVMLADCGHSPHSDQPEQTLDAIASFVRDEGFRDMVQCK
jgi:pimeloyl-ACP methyl ester carboxylesterase